MPRLIYTTDGRQKDHKELKCEQVDSSRNLAQIDLQGLKSKTLQLGINGWHFQSTQKMNSMDILENQHWLNGLREIWDGYIYRGLKKKP